MQTRGSISSWRNLVITGIVPNLLLASCLGLSTTRQPHSPLARVGSQNAVMQTSAKQKGQFEALIATVTFEEMARNATAIFVGQITKISPPQWNQDSGEDWRQWETAMAALPIRYLEVAVIKPITETEALTTPLSITTLALDVTLDEKGNIAHYDETASGLKTGDQAVFFVRQGKIAWRNGARPANMFLGAPEQSYFKLQDDGLYHGQLIEKPLALETLIQRILEARAIP